MSGLPPELESLPSIEKINLVCLLLRSLPPTEYKFEEALLVELESRVQLGELNPSGKVSWARLSEELEAAIILAQSGASRA